MRLWLLIAGVAACRGGRAPAGPVENTAGSPVRPGIPSELCDTLERVIEHAPTSFTALRGKPLPFPTHMDPTGPSDGHWASTVTLAGATTTILTYSWTKWTAELHDPGFTYGELQEAVFACPAVAGWPRDDVSEVPAVTKGATTVFVDDARDPGDGMTIDVHRDRSPR